MDENLHYLLHEELEALFDPPSAQAGDAGGKRSADEARPTRPRTTAPVAAVPAAAAAVDVAIDDVGDDVGDGDAGASASTGPVAHAAGADEEGEIDALVERLSHPDVLQALIRLLGMR